MGTWRTLHSQQILHAPGAISVHGAVSPVEPRTRAFRSGAECSSELPTAESTNDVMIFIGAIQLPLVAIPSQSAVYCFCSSKLAFSHLTSADFDLMCCISI